MAVTVRASVSVITGWHMAYLVSLQPCECQVCGKRATHTLYSKHGVKLGDYCKPCGDMMRLDALSTEYYEGD